jgi:hypothetical protein
VEKKVEFENVYEKGSDIRATGGKKSQEQPPLQFQRRPQRKWRSTVPSSRTKASEGARMLNSEGEFQFISC